ncbi:MAG TPA: acyl-CoA synthetase [Ramlibacter sp.]|nr:acyl-CoA synthetase [Ramlibacter sp.]
MAGWHLLDTKIGGSRPDLGTSAALHAFESVPFEERIAARSTYDVIRLGAAANPDRPALIFLPNSDAQEPGVTITYREFMGGVTQAANMFHALGVQETDVVTLLLPLLPQSFFTLFGGEAAGIANPVNPLLEAAQIAEILRAAGTKVLVTAGPAISAEIWAKVDKIRSELPDLTAVICVGGAPTGAAGVFSWDELAKAQPADRLVSSRRIEPDDIAAYFHTGGTTGMPKLVRHTHLNQVYQAWAIGLMLPSNTILFGLPLFHVGGALTQGLASLGTGTTLVVLSPSGWRNPNSVRNAWKLVERFRPAVFGGVPTVLAAALNVPVEGADVSSIKFCSGGGSAIPVAVAQAYETQFDAPVLEVYGMTETSSVHTISYPDRPVRLGTVGHAVPYSRVRVVEIGKDGKWVDCQPDQIGVVTMSGPGVFSGYLSEKHNRDAFIEPGWVNSGDLGRIDGEGYLWITGRAKDLIIRGGHNIDPAPVEEILFRHPAVAFAAVVGEPDAYAGELPVAYVQLKPGAQADADEITSFVAARTPERAATPVHVHIVDAIPLTGVGKVFKPQLRWDAAERKVRSMLADLGSNIDVKAAAHATHGNMITVRLAGASAALEAEIHKRLDPLVTRHEVVRE